MRIVEVQYKNDTYYAKQFTLLWIPLPLFYDLVVKGSPFLWSKSSEFFKDCLTKDLSKVREVNSDKIIVRPWRDPETKLQKACKGE